ncbi:MAG: polysaccharide biosynthesis/export family protein [Vampirovibrio sp.]|nr:polysaccharide biosynthesis/export family protein [Vampirovibrio sp.]
MDLLKLADLDKGWDMDRFVLGYRVTNDIRKTFAVLFVTTIVTLCALFILAAYPQDLFGHISYDHSAYRIGSGDVLTMHVYHQKDLNQNRILVRADGMASFNGIGEVNVKDRTVSEVQDILAARMGRLIKEPIVTVSLAETKPGTVYLAGAVLHPGMIQIATNQKASADSSGGSRMDLTLSNVLANAGGVKMNADLSQVQIKRSTPAGEKLETVNLWEMLKRGDASQDRMLRSGDSVYIPELPEMAMGEENYNLMLNSSIGPKTFPVRVVGALQKPGVYNVQGDSPYLNSAIAMAGGYTEGSNQSVIAIKRFSNEHDFTTLFVDPDKTDIQLRPNDVVYVSEGKMHKAGKFMDRVNKILAPFTNAALSGAMMGGF